MKTKFLLLAVSALLAATAAPAHADEAALPQMLAKGRACLVQIGALRPTPIFRQHDFPGLMRTLANDIDMAEAWQAYDTATALRFATKAADCEAKVAAWLGARAPQVSLAPAPRQADGPHGVQTASLSAAPNLRHQRFVADVMARRVPASTGFN